MLVTCVNNEGKEDVLIVGHAYRVRSKQRGVSLETSREVLMYRLRNGRVYHRFDRFIPLVEDVKKPFKKGDIIYSKFSSREVKCTGKFPIFPIGNDNKYKSFEPFVLKQVSTGGIAGSISPINDLELETMADLRYFYTQQEYDYIILQKSLIRLRREFK